ncbi:hypothetical protein B0H13DRAFT_2675089 [Mycena leptocephala]|nr:hypothetical protein B0H13DRAFT_2675089 [Mycena leptocephala]
MSRSRTMSWRASLPPPFANTSTAAAAAATTAKAAKTKTPRAAKTKAANRSNRRGHNSRSRTAWGYAEVEVNAVCVADLTTLDATSLVNLSTMREVVESVQTDEFCQADGCWEGISLWDDACPLLGGACPRRILHGVTSDAAAFASNVALPPAPRPVASSGLATHRRRSSLLHAATLLHLPFPVPCSWPVPRLPRVSTSHRTSSPHRVGPWPLALSRRPPSFTPLPPILSSSASPSHPLPLHLPLPPHVPPHTVPVPAAVASASCPACTSKAQHINVAQATAAGTAMSSESGGAFGK